MRVVDFSLKRRVTVSMAAVALMLFGAVAFTRLGVNLMPDLSYPSLTVETRLAGAAPAEVEALIRHWSTPQGGFVVFNYGDPEALGVQPEMTEVMFRAFADQMHYWK